MSSLIKEKLIMKETSISLEIPIHSKTAKHRGIDPELCYLCVSFNEDEKQKYSSMGKALKAFCGTEKSIYFTSHSEFVSSEKVVTNLNEGEFKLFPKFNVIKSLSETTTERLLPIWSAEALIIFFQTDQKVGEIYSSIPELESKWWEYSNEGFEGPYLKQIGNCDPIIFFADSHSSFEIFGTEESITNCFKKLKNL